MIRSLAPGDAEAVACLIREAFAAIPVPLDPAPSGLRVTAAEVLAQEGGAVWDASGAGAGVQGCVLWRMRDGALYLNRVAVRPGLQRRGIARRLLDAAEAEGRRRGVVRLVLEVRLALPGNRRLFAAAGFREVREHAHPGFAVATYVEMGRVLGS